MPHAAHHPTHAVDESDEKNPTHLPVEPEMGPLTGEAPGERPSDGGTEPEG